MSRRSIKWLSKQVAKKQNQPCGGAKGNVVRASPPSGGSILWGQLMSVINVKAIHPIVVEIFLSEPKWWTVGLGDVP